MGKVVKKIVLTGGPCAGKSSSLELIKNYLRDLGYLVLIVNESPTELIKSGIKPFGDNKIGMVEFQDIVLKYQLFKEKLVIETAKKYYDDKEIVIIYDRGIIDYKAYIGKEAYYDLLDKYNLVETDIFNDYDMIIYLETAAKCKSYTTDNNNARSENVSEAIKLDDKTFDAWESHEKIYIIKSNEDFLAKQNEIIGVISEVFDEKRD